MIVCFYGHKGGAGRSAAVANVAPALSGAGYRVLIADFDLEAPGVHRFFGIRDEECAGGVIDLVEAHAVRIAAGGDVELPTFPEELLLEPRFPAVKTLDGELAPDVVRERLLGPRTIGTTTTFETGVQILPAGRLDGRYRERVAAVDWAGRWEDPAWRAFFGWLKVELQARAEVVFLDARAGVTPLAALCLFGLADRVILLTTPTSQALDGALATARALRAAGRGPGDHGTLLVPSRVSKDADREHWGRWLHNARQAVRDPALLPLWAETRGRSQPERAAEDMLERFLLPELAVHAVGEPLVALRMLERGVTQDDLHDRYTQLGATIQRWAVDGRREAAALEGLKRVEEIQARIEGARAERRLDELPALYGRLAEVKLETMTDWAHAREAAALAGQGAAAAAVLGDEGTELRLRVLEGRALVLAEDPPGAERTLAPVVERLQARGEGGLAVQAGGWLGRALLMQEKLERGEPILRAVWETADRLDTRDALEWRILPRSWWAEAVGDIARGREAWTLAEAGPIALAVRAGSALARCLPDAEGRPIAERCRALARSGPRDAATLADAEFAWLFSRDDDTVQEWTRVISLLSELSPPPDLYPSAFHNRAVLLDDAAEYARDLLLAVRAWQERPWVEAGSYAHTASTLVEEQARQVALAEIVSRTLVDLRQLVELGRARTMQTQRHVVAAHLHAVSQSPSAASAAAAVHALEASFVAHPWKVEQGGWRAPFVGIGPLLASFAHRDDRAKAERTRLVRLALGASAPHKDVVPLLWGVTRVSLSPADRRSLLSHALALPDACPEFKEELRKQLSEIPAS